MKKHYPFIFCVISILFLAISCSDDDNLLETPVHTDFGVDKATAEVFEPIQFTNSSENASDFYWDFGDGTRSQEENPRKFYRDPGIFEVTLTSKGENEDNSESKSLTVKILPKVEFTVKEENNLVIGKEVVFENHSTEGVSLLWEFGDADASTSSELNPKFTYLEAGEYTVRLTASAGDDLHNSYSKTIEIKESDDGGSEDTEENEKVLYFIETDAAVISRLDIATNQITEVIDLSGKYGPGMTYNPNDRKIYFSDFYDANEGKIWRVNLDGSEMETLVSGIDDPYGLTLDLVNEKVYWTDNAGNVSRANLDGSNPELGIVNIEGGMMRAIDLDVANNKMYFYEVNDEIVYVSSLDGIGVTELYTGVYGYSLKVDAVNGTIYFNDTRGRNMVRANLDGSGNMITFDSDISRAFGIDIDYDNELVYWSVWNGDLKKANLDGSNLEVIAGGLGTPRGMFIKDKE